MRREDSRNHYYRKRVVLQVGVVLAFDFEEIIVIPQPSFFTDAVATSEMWMMVQKARLFGDEQVAKEMLRTTDPKVHKALGRKVKNFDNIVWDESMLHVSSGFGANELICE